MEENINVAEILKDKPQGTKLYSSACGKCKLEEVDDKSFKISFYNSKFGFMNGGEGDLDKNGKLYDDGECVVFPSKKMRNWEKFSWKKGDVLISDCGFVCIFKEWASDDYTKFNGCYSNSRDGYEDVLNAETAKYSKLDNDTAYGYIRELENRCGGKLNLETLEIEKQLEFKDGDIVFMKGIKGGYFANCIFILRSEYKDGDERAFYYAFYNADDKFTIAEYGYTRVHYSLRPATDSEKQQLFDALAKKNKRWDSEKKQIVDLKPKFEFKPFDKVVVRDTEYSTWCADLFSHIDEDYRYACVGATWSFCIPYNEETAKLIGTTNNVEG